MPRDPWFQRLWWEIFPPPMIKIKVTCHYFDIGDEHFQSIVVASTLVRRILESLVTSKSR